MHHLHYITALLLILMHPLINTPPHECSAGNVASCRLALRCRPTRVTV